MQMAAHADRNGSLDSLLITSRNGSYIGSMGSQVGSQVFSISHAGSHVSDRLSQPSIGAAGVTSETPADEPLQVGDIDALLALYSEGFSRVIGASMDTILQTYKDDLQSLRTEMAVAQPKQAPSLSLPPVRGVSKVASAANDGLVVETHSPRSERESQVDKQSPKVVKLRQPLANGYVPLQLWSGILPERQVSPPTNSINLTDQPQPLQSMLPRHNGETGSEASISRDLPTMLPRRTNFASPSISFVPFQDSSHLLLAGSASVADSHRLARVTSSASSSQFRTLLFPAENEIRPMRSIANMKTVSNHIIQQHLQEVGASTGLSEVGENCEMGDEGNKYISDEGLERAISRRRPSIGSITRYVRKQKRKAFYVDPEEKRRVTILDQLMTFLLRPEEGVDGPDTPLLDLVMSLIVVLNTMVIGISTDVHRSWKGWIVFDVFFALCYLSEFVVKIRLGGIRRFFCGQEIAMNMFDTGLLILAWVEVVFALVFGGRSGASVLRLFRLVRITKVLRVCRLGMFADLLMMINGAIGSFKTLLYSVFLITVPLYVVSLFFHELLSEYSDEHLGAEEFGSLSLTIFNIFRCIIANECTNREGKPIFLRIVENYGWQYGLTYCFTVTFMTFGLFNVIVAIYVENIVTAAKFNSRQSKRKRLLDKDYFNDKCLELLRIVYEVQKRSGAEPSGADVCITPELLEQLFLKEDFTTILHDLDIADEDMIDLFETLDVNANGEVDMEELIIGLARLRGEFRRSDIIGVSLICRLMQEGMAELDAKLQVLQARQNTFFQVCQRLLPSHKDRLPAKVPITPPAKQTLPPAEKPEWMEKAELLQV